MNKIQKRIRILSNEKVCGSFYRMKLDGKLFVAKIKPGQFVNIRVSDGIEPFFRRPFSVSRITKNIEILYDVIGTGTQILAEKKKGETIDILGPLGNAFSLPPKDTKQIVMIAGGIGIAPFFGMADSLKRYFCEKVVLFGGRTKNHICGVKELQKVGCKVVISTDDGSRGIKGRVSKLFSKINKDKNTFVYTCGPKPMMKAVQDFASKHGIKGEVSCEEVMACGVGTCLGCACKTKSGYKTVCHDGPIFNLDEVKL